MLWSSNIILSKDDSEAVERASGSITTALFVSGECLNWTLICVNPCSESEHNFESVRRNCPAFA